MNLDRAMLYARTLPTLRPVQILGRAWSRVRRPQPDLSPPPDLRPGRGWTQGLECEPRLLCPRHACLLNQERSIGRPKDWNRPGVDRLWLYNLHYFDDLKGRGADERAHWHRELIDRWIAENPPGEGVGWEPYPLSLRVVNWIRWSLAGGYLSRRAQHSLAVQARWLRDSLEYHLLGNHLLANAKALVFAGSFFRGSQADDWLCTGLRILRTMLEEQILADGGHDERSPMYHALVLEDLLDAWNLSRAYFHTGGRLYGEHPGHWRRAIELMLPWLAAMTHPDGELAHFNDSTGGVAPSTGEVFDYARRLGFRAPPDSAEGVTHLEDSGYLRVQRDDRVVILDVGEIGPRHLPGHAHADTLSFELSLAGRRVLVNSGVSTYEVGPQRHAERSTAAHNTVVIDGESSSEVWDSFRVARRARPFGLEIQEGEREIQVVCGHDGYRRLRGRPMHRRRWILTPAAVEVRDEVTGGFLRAQARFHLHPDLRLAPGPEPNAWTAGWLGRRALGIEVTCGEPSIERTSFHPGFNLSVPNRCLRVDLADGGSLVRWSG